MNSYPAAVQPLLGHIVAGFERVLGSNLVGIYLHGSLVLGCFNYRTSDVDLLVVIEHPLTPETHEALIALTLQLAAEAPTKGLEFSIVLREHAAHFTYPTPFQFHYGLNWHERFVAGDVDYGADPRNPDLAAHFTITKARGHCLSGEPIAAVFGDVPDGDYWASIRADAADILADLAYNPVYSVLNLCRVLAYRQAKLIVSKAEGAAWALVHVPAIYHALIQQALHTYTAEIEPAVAWNEAELRHFGSYARAVIFT